MKSRRKFIKTLCGTVGIASLSGCITRKDIATLNWKDIRKNLPSARCVFGCPEISLLDDKDQYADLAPEKSEANPLIDSTSVSIAQAYPAQMILVEGTYYALVGSWPRTVGFRSTDGTQWQEINSDVIPLGDVGDIDSYKATPHIFRYEPDSQKYHVLYKAIDDNGTHRYAHAFSDQPLRNYTKSKNNPIIVSRKGSDKKEINSVTLNGVAELNQLLVSDFLISDGDPIYFGSGIKDGDTSFIWIGTGEFGENTRITPTEVLFTQEDDNLTVQSRRDPVKAPNVASPNVVKLGDYYIMSYYSLAIIEDHDFAAAQGKVFSAVGDSPENIRPVESRLLDTGECNSWDELRVYQQRWLKKQDGKYEEPRLFDNKVELYYSGHDCGASKFFGNRGVTGKATYEKSNLLSLARSSYGQENKI